MPSISSSRITSKRIKTVCLHSRPRQPFYSLLAFVDRYTCFEPACACTNEDGTTTPSHFRTWTLLLAHLRDVHPPTCTYPECHGRTFSKSYLLKVHLRWHEGRKTKDKVDNDPDRMAAGMAAEEDDRNDCEPRISYHATKKRRMDGSAPLLKCIESACQKAFQTVRSLNLPCRAVHLYVS